jgi:hypothetical protein
MHMADKDRDRQLQGSQRQESVQSGEQPGAGGAARRKDETPVGIGASQGQDSGSQDQQGRDRPSAGTADIERGTASQGRDTARGSEESLVNESTGAFKERP